MTMATTTWRPKTNDVGVGHTRIHKKKTQHKYVGSCGQSKPAKHVLLRGGAAAVSIVCFTGDGKMFHLLLCHRAIGQIIQKPPLFICIRLHLYTKDMYDTYTCICNVERCVQHLDYYVRSCESATIQQCSTPCSMYNNTCTRTAMYMCLRIYTYIRTYTQWSTQVLHTLTYFP